MSKFVYKTYWIWPQEGDPLPMIGSGLRTVDADVGEKYVNIRSRIMGFSESEQFHIRVTRKVWDEDIPNIVWNENQTLAQLGTYFHPSKA